MATIAITDLTTRYAAGKAGDHNANTIAVTVPDELTALNPDYYMIHFLTADYQSISTSNLTASEGVISTPLWDELTVAGTLKFRVGAYDYTGAELTTAGFSAVGTLIIGEGIPDGVDGSLETQGLMADLQAALSEVDGATEAAITATGLANDAKDAALGAKDLADAATEAAGTATGLANEATEAANTAAGLANEAAQAASQATGLAESATAAANGAAGTALEAAQSAAAAEELLTGNVETLIDNLGDIPTLTADLTLALSEVEPWSDKFTCGKNKIKETIDNEETLYDGKTGSNTSFKRTGYIHLDAGDYIYSNANDNNNVRINVFSAAQAFIRTQSPWNNSISAFEDYSATVPGTTKVTMPANVFRATGQWVVITGTTNYNGTYRLTRLSNTQFYITATYVATETGTGTHAPQRVTLDAEGYVMLSDHKAHTNLQLEAIAAGGAATAYEAYYVDVANFKPRASADIADGAVSTAKIADAAVTFNKVNFLEIGKNLFDKDDVVDGKYIDSNSGAEKSNADYSASRFIPVLPETAYADIYVYSWAFYNSAYVYISGGTYSHGLARTFNSPALAAYIRVGLLTSNLYRYQLEVGTAPTIYEPYQYYFTRRYIPDAYTDKIVLPPKIYGIVGKEINVYFDNIVYGKASKYDFNVTYTGTSTSVMHQNERVNIIPNAAGTYSLTIDIYRDGQWLDTATASVIIKAATVGNAVTKSLIVIGDSTTDTGEVVGEINTLFGAGDVMNITLLGTRGTAPALHEGRAGWKASHYTGSATYAGLTNAFWDGSAFNFPWYMTENEYASVDYVAIAIGINDTLGELTDVESAAANATTIANIQTMVNSIKAFNGGSIIVGVGLVLPPSYNQDAFGANYKAGLTQWRHKRNLDMLNKEIIETFGGLEESGVYVLPINANLDTANNMLTSTAAVNSRNSTQVARQSNALHPAASGYYQVADVYYYFLKSFES